ncbi:hypothetical protein [uncultured Methanobrevibacter sp.]|nr:hypothetical protein [uncultured Methanobrevibacter sp.]
MMLNIFKGYLFANCNSFSIRCYGVPSFHLSEGENGGVNYLQDYYI